MPLIQCFYLLNCTLKYKHKDIRYHWKQIAEIRSVVFKSEGVIIASKKDFCYEQAFQLNEAYTKKYPNKKLISD